MHFVFTLLLFDNLFAFSLSPKIRPSQRDPQPLHHHSATESPQSFSHPRHHFIIMRYRAYPGCRALVHSCLTIPLSPTSHVLFFFLYLTNSHSNYLSLFYEGGVFKPSIEQIRILLKRMPSPCLSSFYTVFRFYDSIYQQYGKVIFK